MPLFSLTWVGNVHKDNPFIHESYAVHAKSQFLVVDISLDIYRLYCIYEELVGIYHCKLCYC